MERGVLQVDLFSDSSIEHELKEAHRLHREGNHAASTARSTWAMAAISFRNLIGDPEADAAKIAQDKIEPSAENSGESSRAYSSMTNAELAVIAIREDLKITVRSLASRFRVTKDRGQVIARMVRLIQAEESPESVDR